MQVMGSVVAVQSAQHVPGGVKGILAALHLAASVCGMHELPHQPQYLLAVHWPHEASDAQ